MNEELKPVLDNILYTNSYGRTYNFGFDFSINKTPFSFSWNIVDEIAAGKENAEDIEEQKK